MSYALESKKRKFERILESLIDNNNQPKRAVQITDRNISATSLRPSYGSDLSKRRRITPTNNVAQVANTSTASLSTHYLPSSRLAFLERLESFRQITKWHIPSTSLINAVEWAKRGWICQDTDTVFCPNCKERLHVDIELDASTIALDETANSDQEAADEEDPIAVAQAVLEGLTKRYQDMIVTAHTGVCPWRRRGCDNSIQRIEGLLNTTTALSGLEKRYRSIIDTDTDIPNVMSLPSSLACEVDEQGVQSLRLGEPAILLHLDTLRLAICGWQKKETDIIECRYCFRSLGLWLYRGLQPTVEHLDAIDSHLEYCPWRSEVAQDTELSASVSKEGEGSRKLPGWTLVYLAVVKSNNKGKIPASRNTNTQEDHVNDENAQPLTPEQREKKMKDLMKRIRDLKKPFNVKSMLKRKGKTQ